MGPGMEWGALFRELCAIKVNRWGVRGYTWGKGSDLGGKE